MYAKYYEVIIDNNEPISGFTYLEDESIELKEGSVFTFVRGEKYDDDDDREISIIPKGPHMVLVSKVGVKKIIDDCTVLHCHLMLNLSAFAKIKPNIKLIVV